MAPSTGAQHHDSLKWVRELSCLRNGAANCCAPWIQEGCNLLFCITAGTSCVRTGCVFFCSLCIIDVLSPALKVLFYKSLLSVVLLPGRKRASSCNLCILFSFSGWGPFLLRREVSQIKYCPSLESNLRLQHIAGVRRALLCPLCPSSVCLHVLLFQTENSLVLIWPYIVISYY